MYSPTPLFAFLNFFMCLFFAIGAAASFLYMPIYFQKKNDPDRKKFSSRDRILLWAFCIFGLICYYIEALPNLFITFNAVPWKGIIEASF